MVAEDKSSKTEKATPEQQRKAAEEGNIARTADLSMWLTVLVFVVIGKSTVTALEAEFTSLIRGAAKIIEAPDVAQATEYFHDAMLSALKIMAPVVLGCMFVGALGHIVQGGLKVSAKRFKPKWKKLNAFTGIKNMFGAQSAWTFVKTLIKFVVFGLIAYQVVEGTMRQITGTGHWAVGTVVSITSASAMLVLQQVAVVGLVIAAADYGMERHRVAKSLRMSKDEIKREHKQQEGDPHVKGARKQRQREMGRMRMMAAVADSTVVITNPAHIAIALKYEQGHGAPQVVAKGAGHLATRIRDEAEKGGVPMVRDVIVARTLYKLCEVDSFIPLELYDAIAQVLAFVMRLSDLRAAEGAHDSPLRHPGFSGADLPEDLTDEALGLSAYDIDSPGSEEAADRASRPRAAQV